MGLEKVKKWKLYRVLCNMWIKRAKRSDQRLGVDFAEWKTNEESNIDPLRGNQYQPTTNGLIRVLEKLPVKNVDAIIDIGCGKGKAMYLMSKFPFAQIDGIDLSAALCNTARKNFEVLKLPQCRAIEADAAEFESYDDYNYFYIFNSFPHAVFEKMLNNILSSIAKKPRKVYFIYLNPVCHDMLISTGVFKLLLRKRSAIRWFQYHCYTNEF